jgi:hypothetical protein
VLRVRRIHVGGPLARRAAAGASLRVRRPHIGRGTRGRG